MIFATHVFGSVLLIRRILTALNDPGQGLAKRLAEIFRVLPHAVGFLNHLIDIVDAAHTPQHCHRLADQAGRACQRRGGTIGFSGRFWRGVLRENFGHRARQLVDAALQTFANCVSGFFREVRHFLDCILYSFVQRQFPLQLIALRKQGLPLASRGRGKLFIHVVEFGLQVVDLRGHASRDLRKILLLRGRR